MICWSNWFELNLQAKFMFTLKPETKPKWLVKLSTTTFFDSQILSLKITISVLIIFIFLYYEFILQFTLQYFQLLNNFISFYSFNLLISSRCDLIFWILFFQINYSNNWIDFNSIIRDFLIDLSTFRNLLVAVTQ